MYVGMTPSCTRNFVFHRTRVGVIFLYVTGFQLPEIIFGSARVHEFFGKGRLAEYLNFQNHSPPSPIQKLYGPRLTSKYLPV